MDTNKFKKIYADGIVYFKLSVEIPMCNRLVQSSGTTHSSDATELNMTVWLAKYGLRDPIL